MTDGLTERLRELADRMWQEGEHNIDGWRLLTYARQIRDLLATLRELRDEIVPDALASGERDWPISAAFIRSRLDALLAASAPAAQEPQCTGPFSDAFDCPVHDPRKAAPRAASPDLREWTTHRPFCGVFLVNHTDITEAATCTCGLAAALARVQTDGTPDQEQP